MKKDILIIVLVLILIFAYNTKQKLPTPGYKDYQIECTMDSMYVFSYGRLVGAAAYDSSMISGIILQDNE